MKNIFPEFSPKPRFKCFICSKDIYIEPCAMFLGCKNCKSVFTLNSDRTYIFNFRYNKNNIYINKDTFSIYMPFIWE